MRPDDADQGVASERVDRGRHDPDGDAAPASGGSDQVHGQGQADAREVAAAGPQRPLALQGQGDAQGGEHHRPDVRDAGLEHGRPPDALGVENELVLRGERHGGRGGREHAEADDSGPQPRARLVALPPVQKASALLRAAPRDVEDLLATAVRSLVVLLVGDPERTPGVSAHRGYSPGSARPARRQAAAPGQAAGQGTG